MKFKSQITTSKGHTIIYDEDVINNIASFEMAMKRFNLWNHGSISLQTAIPVLASRFLKQIVFKIGDKVNVVDNAEWIKLLLEDIQNFNIKDYVDIIDNIAQYYADWLHYDEKEEEVKNEEEVKKNSENSEKGWEKWWRSET